MTHEAPAQPAPPSFEAQERETLRTCFEDLLYVLRMQGHRALVPAALAAAGLMVADLRQPSRRLTFDALYAALTWVYRDARLPLIGIHLGLRRRFADYGAFGAALQATEQYARLLSLAARYFAAAWGHATLEVRSIDRLTVSRYHLHPGVVADPVPLLQAMTAASVAFCREVWSAEHLEACEVRYPFPAPAHAAEIRALLGCKVRFGQRHAEFCHPRQWMDLPVDMGVVRRPRLHAEAQHLWRAAGAEAGWSGRVQRLLIGHDGCFASEADIAERLGVTPRTLRRRLTDEGQSFRRLVIEARLDLARRHLEQGDIRVADIAERLGYAQPASFYRAYKARFGHPPRGDIMVNDKVDDKVDRGDGGEP